MNRVIIGAVTLLVVAGIILLAVRTVRGLNLSQLFQRPVPRTGRLVLPSQAPGTSPSGLAAGTPNPLSSPSPFVPSSFAPGASVAPQATAPAARSSFPNPSPSVTPATGGGQLPATGF